MPKAQTGLLEQAEAELGISLVDSYFVGDSLKDMQAASAFNMAPILVRTGKGRETELSLSEKLKFKTIVFNNLKSAVRWILAQK